MNDTRDERPSDTPVAVESGLRMMTSSPEARRVEQSGGGVARRVVRTRDHTARVVRTENIRETGLEQCFRQVLHPTREESQHGWGLDDDVVGHPSSVSRDRRPGEPALVALMLEGATTGR